MHRIQCIRTAVQHGAPDERSHVQALPGPGFEKETPPHEPSRCSLLSTLDLSRRSIAYFSMEIALSPALPTYSGGLGMLAGDTLRSAADTSAPMVAISLVHRRGYFRQQLSDLGPADRSRRPLVARVTLPSAGQTITLTHAEPSNPGPRLALRRRRNHRPHRPRLPPRHRRRRQ